MAEMQYATFGGQSLTCPCWAELGTCSLVGRSLARFMVELGCAGRVVLVWSS